MITLERLRRAKVMITQLGVDWSIPISKKHCKLIAVDLCKQKKLNAESKAIQQINFTGDLDRAEGSTMFLIIEKAKETVLDFSKVTVKVS